MTPYSKAKIPKKRQLLLIVSGVFVILIMVWLGYLVSRKIVVTNTTTNRITATELLRYNYDDLYQLHWRLTDQDSNVSIEATLFLPELKQALFDLADPSDHQLAMIKELEKISADNIIFYVVMVQPDPFVSDPDLTDLSKIIIDNDNAVADWAMLDPLWLDQSQYFQRDGFLYGKIDDLEGSVMLDINYPSNVTHKFNWLI